MSRKGAPTYDLSGLQALVLKGKWVGTRRAFSNAALLKLDPKDVRECLLALSLDDFHKTMASETVPGTFHDVYKPTYLGRNLYVKVQISTEPMTVVIQFKRDESR